MVSSGGGILWSIETLCCNKTVVISNESIQHIRNFPIWNATVMQLHWLILLSELAYLPIVLTQASLVFIQVICIQITDTFVYKRKISLAVLLQLLSKAASWWNHFLHISNSTSALPRFLSRCHPTVLHFPMFCGTAAWRDLVQTLNGAGTLSAFQTVGQSAPWEEWRSDV